MSLAFAVVTIVTIYSVWKLFTGWISKIRLNVQWYRCYVPHRRLWNCIRFCNNRKHAKWDSHESFYQEFCDEKDFQLFSWEHLWHSTVDAKIEGKAIKNAKFIQAYGFKIEQISKHCNRLCWTQWNQFRWLYHCFEWADWVKLHQIETRPTKNQWQLEKRCWCQKTRKRLDKSKNIIEWMEKVGGHGDEWEPLDMCCCIPFFCVSTRKFMFACVCVVGCQKQILFK